MQNEERDKINKSKDSFPPISRTNSPEAIGTQISEYKILSVLGEGGFGIVYLAEQKKPFRRQVALKVIKPGMDSKQIIARFESERQALALLDHPNIAHIFDGGITESGRLYFVMEYVKGISITEYCDQNKLTIEERLELFLQVCEAIQYAHHKAIIHRDIKPSNILVSAQGERTTPIIIDFGVAKALSQPLTEHTLFTEQGQLIGTPEYMSPEQAGMATYDIDTRSDIYSLGVVLYELLTGALPFDPKTLRQAAFGEIQRIIREEEPPRPSTRISSLGEIATEIAQKRHIDVKKLIRRLHSELEWIPLMAMRKEPDRRYATAHALADDIHNYLDGEPLLAGPESRTYRLKKTIKQYKALVTGVAVVLVVLITGIVVSTHFALQSNKAAKNEQDQRIIAEQEKKKAEQATEDASAARRQAQSAYVDQLVESGFRAHEQANPAEAALWFSSAALQSKQDSPEQARVNRLRAYAWLEQAPLPISVFQVAAEPYRLWLSANDNLLLVEDRRHHFTLWDVNQSRQIELSLTGVSAAAFDPNGQTLAIGNTKGQVQLLSLPQLRDPHIFNLEEPISALLFDRSGSMVAFGGKSIRVWNRETSQFLEGNFDLDSRAAYLVFGQHSDYLVAVDVNDNLEVAKLTRNSIRIDEAFSRVKHIVDTKSWGINPFPPLITPTNQLIVRNPLNTLEGYQLDAGNRTWRLELKGPITSISLSSDGKWIALGRERQMELWRYGESKATHVHSGPIHCAVATSIDSTDSLLAHGGYNRRAQIWSLDQEGHREFTIQHQDQIVDLKFASRNPNILVTAQRDGLIRIWRLPRKLSDRKIVVGASEHAVVSSWDGKYVMSGGNYYRRRLLKMTQVHEIASGNPTGPPLRPGGLLNGCAFAPDGLHAVTLSTLPAHSDRTLWSDFNWDNVSGLVTFWNWRSGEKQGEPIQTPSEPIGAEFQTDGRWLFVVCAAGQILVIHSKTHEVIRTMDHKAHADPVWTVPRRWIAVSPDNSKFATVGLGNWLGAPYMVRVWDPNSGQALYAVKHNMWIYDASFSPDGKWLGTASADNTVRIWDASSGKEIACLVHPYWVITIQFDKSSQKILTACLDGSARLWDWPNGSIEQEYIHDDEVKNAKFAMNESVVVTVSNDGDLSFWSSPTGHLIAPPRKLSQSYKSYAEYLEVSADGEYVVANGNSIFFDVFQFPNIPSIHEQTLTDLQLQRLAQLCAGYRIEGAKMASMTSQTWCAEWDYLKSDGVMAEVIRRPDVIQRTSEQIKTGGQAEYQAGISLLKERQYVDAIVSFTQALEENPELGDAYYQRACCFIDIKSEEMAVADLSEAIRCGEVTSYNLRAGCYLRLGQPKEALHDILDWRRVNPPRNQREKSLNASWLLACASRVGDRGDLANAISALNIAATDLEQVVEKDDLSSANDYCNLVTAYSLLTEYESRLHAPEHRDNELKNLAEATIEKFRLKCRNTSNRNYFKYLIEAEKILAGEGSQTFDLWECIVKKDLTKASKLLDELKSEPPSDDPYIDGRIRSVSEQLILAYWDRALTNNRIGQYGEATSDLDSLTKIDPNHVRALNFLAWLKATCPNAQFRDGDIAIKKASKACELTSWKESGCLDTLAAGYAETGDYINAVKWQKEAIKNMSDGLQSGQREEYEARLILYEQEEPYHQQYLWPNQLIAHYTFDEVKGKEVIDSSVHHIDGILRGDAQIIDDPVRGKVLKLDGDGDWIDCGNDVRFNMTETITIAVWIKVDDFSKAHQAIITKGDLAWRLQGNGERDGIAFACTGTTVEGFQYGSIWRKADIIDGNWHHVVGTYDGTNMMLYIDGNQNLSARASGKIRTYGSRVLIGATWYGLQTQPRELKGLIDDVRIYSYGLTEAEVKALYESSISKQ
jgi:serine/threonine protein kinase/WD40 repeat protein